MNKERLYTIVCLALVIAIFLALATHARAATMSYTHRTAHNAPTLVGPAATVAKDEKWIVHFKNPVGVPSEHVNLLSSDPGCVGAPAGCSYPGFTHATTRWSLAYELGHQMDWLVLTNADRTFLAAKWHLTGWHWADTQAGLAKGYEDGLEGLWPEYVAMCAFYGGSMAHQSFTAGGDGWPTVGTPVAHPGSFDTCGWIRSRF